jgi:DNA-binding response OmpR family regulator
MEQENQTIDRKKINILLVEDNENLGGFLRDYLIIKGFSCHWVKDGAEALSEFFTWKYNFCILDVMLPKKDGFSLAYEIREQSERVPILFLTAKDNEADRLKGFSLGCDDYMTKPFSMEELVMRISAIIRRMEDIDENLSDKVILGKLKFDFNKRIVYFPAKKGAKSEEDLMSNKVNEIIRILCAAKDELVYRDALVEKIWETKSIYTSRSLDVYINKVRKLFQADPNILLLNVHGVGYKLSVTKSRVNDEIRSFVTTA